MPMEPNVNAIWFGGQSAKATENTTPIHRAQQLGGDFNIVRDDGSEQWSDLTKYGGTTDWVNNLTGTGNPVLEATPSELGALLYLMHGSETRTAGTNNVWTLGGSPASGAFVLNICDGAINISVASQANTVASAALQTAINSAMNAAGYGASSVACTGGPLNTTPIVITFSGTGAASRPFYLSNSTDTTSPAATLTNTTPGVRTKHNVKPALTPGLWTTWCRRIGTSVIQRQSFIDTFVGGLTLEAGTGSKAMRMTPNLISLDPGKVLSADPAQALPTGVDSKPFLYTDGSGAFTVDGFVQAGQSQMQLTITEDRSPVYGDDVVAYDTVVGDPGVTIAATVIFDATGLAEYNRLVYGTASPTAGTKPLKNLPALGSYSLNIQQKGIDGNTTGNRLVVSIPGVKWAIPDAPDPNPSGGNVEISLAGSMRPLGGSSDPYSIDVYNADTAAYTV